MQVSQRQNNKSCNSRKWGCEYVRAALHFLSMEWQVTAKILWLELYHEWNNLISDTFLSIDPRYSETVYWWSICCEKFMEWHSLHSWFSRDKHPPRTHLIMQPSHHSGNNPCASRVDIGNRTLNRTDSWTNRTVTHDCHVFGRLCIAKNLIWNRYTLACDLRTILSNPWFVFCRKITNRYSLYVVFRISCVVRKDENFWEI